MKQSAGRERIAIVRLSALGDVLQALPALEALRAARPESHITWIVEAQSASLLKGHHALDELLVFPKEAVRALFPLRTGSFRAAGALLGWFRDLRRMEFDLAIDLQGNLKSGIVTRSTFARRRVGLPGSHAREPNRWATHAAPCLPERPIHECDKALAVLASAGVPARWRPTKISGDDRDEAAALAAVAKSIGSGPVVLLQPGTSARMPNKRWPIARWQDLILALREDFDARVIVHAGPGDEAARELRWRHPEIALADDLPSLKALAVLLQRVDLVIGADTGPTHLAEVLGRRVLILLGPTDPRRYYPYGHPERALFERIGCAPCRHRNCPMRLCMDQITVSNVMRHAGSILGPAPAIHTAP